MGAIPRIVLLCCLAISSFLLAQPPGPGGPGGGRGRGGGPQIKAIDVHPDNTVTFHFNAPTAKEIMLVANFLPEPLALLKDDKELSPPPQNRSNRRFTTIDTLSRSERHRSAQSLRPARSRRRNRFDIRSALRDAFLLRPSARTPR
jgi:hypothetical protein